MMKKIKWGILGTSPISEVMAKAIIESETGELVAIASRSDERGRIFASNFSLKKVYSDCELLLADPSIDVVYIGLPNHVHKEWILHAAQAGKHILCEKPLVLTKEEALLVISAATRANVLCMEALMYRHHPFIDQLKGVIKENRLGKIRHINGLYCANIAHRANTIAGGSIRNLGCYPISLLRYLLDEEPTSMVSTGRIGEKEAVRQASAVFQFANGAMATISTADDLEMVWRFEVFGTKADLLVQSNPWLPAQEGNLALVKDKKGNDLCQIATSASKPLYSYQIDAMGNALGSSPKVQSLISLEDSLGNIQILEQWMTQVLAASVWPSSPSNELM